MGFMEFMFGEDKPIHKPDKSNYAFGAAEKELQGMYAQQARGEGPSVAENQLKSGLRQASTQMRGDMMANAAVNPALSARMAQRGHERMASDVNQQAAGLRAQEQLQGRQAYGDWLMNENSMGMAYDQLMAQQAMAQPAKEGLFNKVLGAGLQAGAGYLASMGMPAAAAGAATGAVASPAAAAPAAANSGGSWFDGLFGDKSGGKSGNSWFSGLFGGK
jgi:hypothetical protein